MPIKSATFAMGCFWSPDARFGSTPGIVRTQVGYTGGQHPDPTYKKLGDHTESVQVDYDPERISYKQLLEIFWTGHNPVKPVWGPQYMSAIFYHDAEQQRLADESLVEQCHNGLFRLPTQILPLQKFYPAEAYHQKYALRHRQDLMHELSTLFPDEPTLMDSTAAARLNGVLDGFGQPAELATELAAADLSPAVAQRLAELLQKGPSKAAKAR